MKLISFPQFSYLVIFLLICSKVIIAQPFKVFGVSDLSPIFEDGYKLPKGLDTLDMFALKGETVSGQFVLNSLNELSEITIEINPLLNLKSKKPFPGDKLEWNFVGSVFLPSNAPNQPADMIIRTAPARFPDYLMAERKINVDKGKYQAIWLTVQVPGDTEPGIYQGSVAIKYLQGRRLLPIRLQIYPLLLSPERRLKIAVRYSVNNFEKYHGIAEKYSRQWFDMLKKYAENMADHRQNVMQAPISAIDISIFKDGSFHFNFERFDQIVQVFMNTGKMDFIETGYGLTKFGKGEWFSADIELCDFVVRDFRTNENRIVSGRDVVPLFLPAFERHLRQKGWLDKTLLSVRNEPSLHNAEVYRELSDYFHELAPGIRQFESIETTMYGGLDIPGPKLDHLATWYDTFRERQEEGTEVCYYIVGIYQGSRFPDKTIDLQVLDSRVMPWLNYRYNLSGIKHWGWNSWTDDPYNDVGQHLGDGWHVYPVKNGILNSLRWEQMRNGIQDYECFRILESEITSLRDSLGSHFSWIDPRQRGVEISGQVVHTFADRTDDPTVLESAKLKLIDEILDYNVTPRIYIQTNPNEGAELTSGSLIEVFGWAEPGTKVIVNKRELPVSDEGLFLEQFGLRSANTKIQVIAEKDGKKKEVTREFKVR